MTTETQTETHFIESGSSPPRAASADPNSRSLRRLWSRDCRSRAHLLSSRPGRPGVGGSEPSRMRPDTPWLREVDGD
jgi:hypothetical protein